MSMSKTKRKTSTIWNYFSETDSPNRVRCNHCNKTCSISGGSTGNLIRHIKIKHKVSMKEITETEKSYAIESLSKDMNQSFEEPVHAVLEFQCESSTETQAAKSTTVIEEPAPVQQSSAYYLMEELGTDKGKELDGQVLRIIVKELHPFNVIENQEFIAFVSMLNPNYTLPSRKSLSNEMLQELYQSTVREVKSALKNVTSVALATDRWTSINNENFIAVTAYFLDKKLELQAKLLDCISFDKITSIKIVVLLQELAAFWGLSNKIVAVVTEDVPLLTEAVKECQWQHIPCFAHALNRIVKAGLEDISAVITKVRNTVLHFKTSELALTKFSMLQANLGLADIKLKKDSSVGWNSTFEMMTAFLKNKDSLTAAADVLGEDSLKLSHPEWAILENAVKLLIPFNTITAELCSEKVVPLSKIPHMVRFMMKHITSTSELQNFPKAVQKMGCTLKRELMEQFKNLESNDVICQSVLLDPRIKKRGFQENSFKEAYSSLHKKVVSLKNKKLSETNTEHDSTPHVDQANKQSEFFIDMWSEFRENDSMHQMNVTPVATVEIDAFLTEPYMNMKENPITYWANKLNQNKFPTLFELVKSRLCVPGTSVPCKNIFSKAGNALAKKRTLLTSGKLNEILFLHQNLL